MRKEGPEIIFTVSTSIRLGTVEVEDGASLTGGRLLGEVASHS